MPAAHGEELMNRVRGLKDGTTVLVIGAGCSGLALCTEMVQLGERRTIVVVDRNDKVGGMWLTPYEGLGLHGPRKSVSHPATWHLWEGLSLEGQCQPADLCTYFARVQVWLEERGVRFLLGSSVESDADVLYLCKGGAKVRLDPIEYVIDARCSNIKTQFAVPLKKTPGRRDTLIIGSGKQGADVAIGRVRNHGDDITFASRVPICFVSREKLTDEKAGLFAALIRLSKPPTKREWLELNEQMVREGVLINPWEEATGNAGVEFHGGILSQHEIDTLRMTKFIRSEVRADAAALNGPPYASFGNVIRCTGAFREAAVRDHINNDDRMKTMRFLYSPIVSAQLFCAIGSHGINGHPINYALYPNRFAMMNQLMCELAVARCPDFKEIALKMSNPIDADDLLVPGSIQPMKFVQDPKAGVAIREGEALPALTGAEGETPTVVILPADDSSASHFKALSSCLQSLGQAAIVTVETADIRGCVDASALADLILKRCGDSKTCYLLGYSMGALLANALAAHFSSAGRPLRGICLLSPIYIPPRVGPDPAASDTFTKLMASFVLDPPTLEQRPYDWAAIRSALVTTFPFLGERFEGFELWRTLVANAGESLEASEALMQCPMLLIVSEFNEKTSDGTEGGAGCIAPWQAACPHAQVAMVACTQMDMPFSLPALDRCIDFMLPRVDFKARVAGRQAMGKILESMNTAKGMFKKSWERKYANTSFVTLN